MILQIIDGHIAGYTLFGGTYDNGGVKVPDDALDGCDPAILERGCYMWIDGAVVLDTGKLDGQIAAERAAKIRARRETECFTIINRGALWYDRLSPEQRAELDEWYQAWLDAPQTSVVPAPLKWIEPQTYDEGGLS